MRTPHTWAALCEQRGSTHHFPQWNHTGGRGWEEHPSPPTVADPQISVPGLLTSVCLFPFPWPSNHMLGAVGELQVTDPKDCSRNSSPKTAAERGLSPAGASRCRREDRLQEPWEARHSQQPAKQGAPNRSASPLDGGGGWINCAISMTFYWSLNVLVTVHPRNRFFLPRRGEKYPSEFFRLCDRLANCC